jgi:hypothetical protein
MTAPLPYFNPFAYLLESSSSTPNNYPNQSNNVFDQIINSPDQQGNTTNNPQPPLTQNNTPLSSEDIKWSNLPPANIGFQTANRVKKGDIETIVLHETLGETPEIAVETLRQRKLSYHNIVGKNGIVTEYVNPKDIAWGAKGVNAKAINIAAAHTQKDPNITGFQQDAFERLIRKYVDRYHAGKPIAISYHGQHGGTDCNVFGTHAAYEQWVKTRLGDLLQAGKIKLADTQNIVNQANEQGTQILTENGKNYNTVV